MAQKERNPKSPFLYPDSVDLVVLGNVNESVKREWNVIGRQVKAKTLIVPDVPEAEELYRENVNEIIRLRPGCGDDEALNENAGECQWNTAAAGWKFEVRCWNAGALTLWYDLADVSSERFSAEQKEIENITDCVMSVKATENSLCCKNRTPDEYGCAAGCVLHRDYDVCKFRYANRANPYLTGTLLTAETGVEEKNKEFLDWLSAKLDSIRFYSMQNLDCWMDILVGNEGPEPGARRYFIGRNDEMSDHAAAQLCKRGFGSTPVILTEGHGVCCSGLLNYAEA